MPRSSSYDKFKNLIDDVPMRFSERYLSLLKKSQEEENSCDDYSRKYDENFDDLSRFKIEDYEFESELSALEMYELNDRRRQQEKLRRDALDAEIKKRMLEAVAQQELVQKTMTLQAYPSFVTGEILQPQPLTNSPSTASSSSSSSSNTITTTNISPKHQNCDMKCNPGDATINQQTEMKPTTSSSSSASSSLVTSTAITNQVNTREFENNLDSSPFDNVELQTIDDISELNKVFQGLTTTTTSTVSAHNSSGNNLNNNIESSLAKNGGFQQRPPFTTTTTPYQSYIGGVLYPSTNYLYDHNHQQNIYNHQHQNNSGSIGYHQTTQYQTTTNNPTQQSMMVTTPYAAHNSFYGMAPAINPPMYHPYNHQPSPVYSTSLGTVNPNQNTVPIAMTMFGGVPLAMTPSRSKSVSDLSTSCDSISRPVSDHHPNHHYQRSRTPPHGNPNGIVPNTIINSQQQRLPTKTNKNQKLPRIDPYETLDEKQKQFVDRLCQMGYQRDRISRAVKHMDIDDDKKIYEFLLAIQQLEDKGYDCYDVEIALHFNNYHKDKAEIFLKILKEICDYGFDKEMAIKALLKTNNNRDKAIDWLLKSSNKN